jgi:hypothetical protein
MTLGCDAIPWEYDDRVTRVPGGGIPRNLDAGSSAIWGHHGRDHVLVNCWLSGRPHPDVAVSIATRTVAGARSLSPPAGPRPLGRAPLWWCPPSTRKRRTRCWPSRTVCWCGWVNGRPGDLYLIRPASFHPPRHQCRRQPGNAAGVARRATRPRTAGHPHALLRGHDPVPDRPTRLPRPGVTDRSSPPVFHRGRKGEGRGRVTVRGPATTTAATTHVPPARPETRTEGSTT